MVAILKLPCTSLSRSWEVSGDASVSDECAAAASASASRALASLSSSSASLARLAASAALDPALEEGH
jgi:hypothetical protein